MVTTSFRRKFVLDLLECNLESSGQFDGERFDLVAHGLLECKQGAEVAAYSTTSDRGVMRFQLDSLVRSAGPQCSLLEDRFANSVFLLSTIHAQIRCGRFLGE